MPLYGPEWPLKSGNKDVWEMYEDLNQQINFYLKNLLMTSPGENTILNSYTNLDTNSDLSFIYIGRRYSSRCIIARN